MHHKAHVYNFMHGTSFPEDPVELSTSPTCLRVSVCATKRKEFQVSRSVGNCDVLDISLPHLSAHIFALAIGRSNQLPTGVAGSTCFRGPPHHLLSVLGPLLLPLGCPGRFSAILGHTHPYPSLEMQGKHPQKLLASGGCTFTDELFLPLLSQVGN